MEQSIKMPPFITDLKMMGGFFYIPIIIYLLILGIQLPNKLDIIELFTYIQLKDFMGLICVPCISLWVIGLFKNIVRQDLKEVFLSLPYSTIKFGFLRVLRVFLLYILIFYVVLILVLEKKFTLEDIYLPLIGMIFFTSISFATIMILKNELYTYVTIGVIAIYEYSTRGALTGWFYPFHWILKRPYYSYKEIIILLVTSILMLLFGQLIFNKREYLIR